DEAIKIGKHLLENAESIDEKISYSQTVANGYLVKGDYNNALFYAFEVNNQAAINEAPSTTKERIHLTLLKFEILKTLNLNSQADAYIEEAKQLIRTINNTKIENELECELLLTDASVSLEIGDINHSFELLNDIQKQFQNEILNNSQLKQKFHLISGAVKSELGDYISAKELLNSSLTNIKQEINPNYFERAISLNYIGRLHFLNKNHQEAIENLLLAIEEAKQIENI